MQLHTYVWGDSPDVGILGQLDDPSPKAAALLTRICELAGVSADDEEYQLFETAEAVTLHGKTFPAGSLVLLGMTAAAHEFYVYGGSL